MKFLHQLLHLLSLPENIWPAIFLILVYTLICVMIGFTAGAVAMSRRSQKLHKVNKISYEAWRDYLRSIGPNH